MRELADGFKLLIEQGLQGYADVEVRRGDGCAAGVRIALRRESHPCSVCLEPTYLSFVFSDGYVAMCSRKCLAEMGGELADGVFHFVACDELPPWREAERDAGEVGN